MAASDVTVTGNLTDALGIAYDYTRTKMWLTFNTANNRVTDDEGVVRLDAGAATVNADGSFSLTGIPVPGSSNPTAFQVKIHYDAPPRLPGVRNLKREAGDFGWMTITADATLTELEDEQAVPPNYQTTFTEAMEAIRDESEANLADQVDLSGISTSDDVVEALVKNTGGAGPKTSAALTTSYATVRVYDEDTSSYPERPDGAASVLWVGPTQPPEMTADDLWQDTDSVSGYKWQRDAFTATLTASVTVTLGATPVADSETVWIKPAAGTAYVAAEKGVHYSMTGNVIVVTLAADDRCMIKYQYSADQAGGAAVVNQPVLYVSDTFTRGDSASTLGSAETGQPWQLLTNSVSTSPTMSISSNKAYVASSPFDDHAVIDSLHSDCTIELKIDTIAASGSLGLDFRASGSAANHLFTTNQTALFKRNGSFSNSQILAFSQTFVAGDTMRIVLAGSLITVYRDAGSTGTFVQVGQITDAFNQTATKHGWRSGANASNANRVDNFRVYA